MAVVFIVCLKWHVLSDIYLNFCNIKERGEGKGRVLMIGQAHERDEKGGKKIQILNAILNLYSVEFTKVVILMSAK
jgi:hypothetical protein